MTNNVVLASGWLSRYWTPPILLAAGLDRELAAAGEGLDAVGRARLAQAASTLVMPGEMGERFKVMALTRGLDEPLSGFAFRDLAATL